MTGAIAYCSLFGVGLGAYFGLSWIILLFSTAILTLIAVLEHRQYSPRLAAVGMEDLLHTTAMASFANGLLASVAAYAIGFVVRSVFGG
jgi:hypothetical protein